MGGRVVVGRKHDAHCEFPFQPCICSDPTEVINLIKNKLHELEALVNILEKIVHEDKKHAHPE